MRPGKYQLGIDQIFANSGRAQRYDLQHIVAELFPAGGFRQVATGLHDFVISYKQSIQIVKSALQKRLIALGSSRSVGQQLAQHHL